MASNQVTVDFNVLGLDKVETLVHLLAKHMDDLPCDLKQSLKDLADCDHCEVGVHNIANHRDYHVFVDGKVAEKVVSINPVLRRVTFIDGSGNKYYKFPVSASIMSKSKELLVSF